MSARHYKRRDFLKAAGLGAAALALPGGIFAGGGTRSRSNIVLVHIDNLGLLSVGSVYAAAQRFSCLIGEGPPGREVLAARRHLKPA